MKYRWLCVWICPLLAAASPFERGMKAKAAGDFPLASRELARAVQAKPQDVVAWRQYGTVLGWQGRHQEALDAFERGLAIAPTDYDLRVARARVIAWMGNYDLASKELAKLAVENPKDDDVVTMQGRVAGWSGRPSEAEIYYYTVLARNPNQVDALTGLGDLARDRRKRDKASDFYRRALAIDSSPDIQRRLTQLQNEKLMRVDFGLTASTFTGSTRSDWGSAWTQFSRQSDWGNFWGRVEQGERFDKQDTVIEIGWAGTPVDGWNAGAIIGGSPDAFWAPEYYAEANVHWLPQTGWPTLVTDLRYAEYVPREVTTLRAGFDYNLGNGWNGLARWVHQVPEGASPTDGWILSIDKEYPSGFAWRLGAAHGAESLDGQSLGVAGKVLFSQTWFGGVRGPINDDWGWRVDLEFEDVRGGPNRRGISVGFSHKF